ncbi:MAG: hypothetical protein HXX08_05645 [Chloroflexi bacterium]|uniref:Methyl-accepting chemotaxis protein n=1 Tax=Candidatus Chlorohelix allophototropha TaxID=3003348 RepID=A0A8T7M2K2_9CHLR|nr:hypothetical protein [Chloroflexota bacterium]WJW67219.1 methyl-accepting chemotaxis protein [Chloroflexota bacterium L227-S17]
MNIPRPQQNVPLLVSQISVATLGLLVILLASIANPSAYDPFTLANFSINSDIIYALLLVVTGWLCNRWLIKMPNGLYASFSMLPIQATFLIYPAAPAAIIVLIPCLLLELFQLKRGLFMAIYTAGIFVLATVAARYIYEGVGGNALVGDLKLNNILAILIAFLMFGLVSELLMSVTTILQGNLPWKNLSERVPYTTLYFGGMLLGSILLAILKFETGIIAFGLACSVAIVLGLILRQYTDTKNLSQQRMEKTRLLNQELERINNARQVAVTQINNTLYILLHLVQEYSGTSQDQQVAMIQITATIEELSRTATQIATSSDQVAKAASATIETTQNGQIAVRDTITAIQEAQVKMQEINIRILDLNQKSELIGDILATINSLSNEIRLLALNATIEASGAGIYGKRFAVVAGEVNELADRSKQAAQEIRRIINDIQYATTSSVRVTAEGLEKMERSVITAKLSEEANLEIIKQVELTAQSAESISSATQQQQHASEQVVSSVYNVTSMLKQNNEKMENVSAAATELEQAMEELLKEK